MRALRCVWQAVKFKGRGSPLFRPNPTATSQGQDATAAVGFPEGRSRARAGRGRRTQRAAARPCWLKGRREATCPSRTGTSEGECNCADSTLLAALEQVDLGTVRCTVCNPTLPPLPLCWLRVMRRMTRNHFSTSFASPAWSPAHGCRPRGRYCRELHAALVVQSCESCVA